MFEVIVEDEFAAAHALRHYHGAAEPLHGHNFRVQVAVRGKRLQNKVQYLIDFIPLQQALRTVLRSMDHRNLNDHSPFDRENPSAENLARHIGEQLRRRWHEKGAALACVTVWETSRTAARYWFSENR